jgi:hypothetical protein
MPRRALLILGGVAVSVLVVLTALALLGAGGR